MHCEELSVRHFHISGTGGVYTKQNQKTAQVFYQGNDKGKHKIQKSTCNLSLNLINGPRWKKANKVKAFRKFFFFLVLFLVLWSSPILKNANHLACKRSEWDTRKRLTSPESPWASPNWKHCCQWHLHHKLLSSHFPAHLWFTSSSVSFRAHHL